MSEDAPQLFNQPDPEGRTIVPIPESGVRVTQILPEVTPWFQAAFERHAQEDDVSWEIGLIQLPTDSRGNFVSLIAIFAAIPGAVLGTLVMANRQIQPYGLNAEAVDTGVREIMEQLRESRSEQLKEMDEAGKLNAQFGSKPPTNGLIIPSQR
jgi:hypothetical protein